MSISDGVPATAANFNGAFLSRTQNSATVGVVGLNNSVDPNSGSQIVNTQRAINELFDADGTSGEGDAARKDYASTNYIADGDSRKTAIEKLDQALAVIAGAAMGTSPEIEVFTLSAGDITNKYVTLSASPSVASSTLLTVKGYPVQFYGDDYSVSGNVVGWTGTPLDGALIAGDKLKVTYWVASSPEVEQRTVTGGEIAAKQLTLASSPTTPTKVILSVAGFPEQFYLDDYIVTGNILDWNGLGLDGVLTAGDEVRIMYWL
jgi:hypothetical protein